jgi:hypothetical protein
MKADREYGGKMQGLENELALAWLEEQLARVSCDGHPKIKAILMALKDDLEFEMNWLRYTSRVEPVGGLYD